MMTKKPKREQPNPETRAKARRAFRIAAQSLTTNQAVQLLDARGKPRNNRFVVKV